MKKYLYSYVLPLFLAVVFIGPMAHAETTSTGNASLLEQIRMLTAKIESLQKQLTTLRTEVNTVIKKGLSEGTTDEDIKKIQKILATDPSIYPQGMVTGYFGPLTKDALKRFQERHELKVTGVLDDETREYLEEYLNERFDGDVPPGLLKAPGIAKKIELRMKEGCDTTVKGKSMVCDHLKMKYKDGSLTVKPKKVEDVGKKFEVEIEIETEDGETTTEISFVIDGKEYNTEVDSTTQMDVLEAVADELGTTIEKMNRDLMIAVKLELAAELKDEDN